jgi:hypothetical protein
MAVAQRVPQASVPSKFAAAGIHPIVRLAQLHAEAQETAQLANLLGRSIHAASALVLMTVAALAFGGAGLAESVTWTVFMLAGAGAVVAAYRRTIGQPFERAALKSFSHDLHAILLFAGFAWGAGAFLALSTSVAIGTVVLFSAGASAVIALLLRDRQCAFLFLAPVTALSSFACVLRPLSGGALDAAAVLVACGLVGASAFLADRTQAVDTEMPELAGLPQA